MQNQNLAENKFNLQNFISSFPIDPYFYYVVFSKNKKTLFFIPLFVSLLILLISNSIDPKFKSTASLIIETDNTNIIDIDQVYDPLTSQNAQKNFINTQVQILSSYEIVKRMFQNENFLKEIKTIYENRKKDSFVYELKEKLNRLDDQEINIENLIFRIKDSISVKADNASNIIRLTSVSSSSKESYLILNQLINTFREYDIDQKISITSYANTKINERLDELKTTLEKSENDLYAFKQNNKLIDLGNIKELKAQEIKQLSDRLINTEAQYQQLGNDLQQIKISNSDFDELITLSTIKDSAEVVNLLQEYEGGITNIESLLITYKNNHPKIEKLQVNVDNIKEQLEDKINQKISTMSYDYANMANLISLTKEELENAREELQDLELKDIQMKKYVREVEMNEKIYQSFMERLKETSEAKELQTPNAKVLDIPLIPDSPFSPNITLNTFFGFFLSLLTIYLLAVYYESYKITINEPNDIEKHGYELLNLIPKVEEKLGYHVPINFVETESGPLKESIIATKALMKNQFKEAKCIIVTSPLPQEGKTTLSLNLALAHAVENKKCLFLETDFRRPSVSKVLDLEKQKGLSHIMKGQATFSESIVNLYGSGLDIITAGESTNLSLNFNANQFNEFVKVLKSKYDYIFIDTAPVQPIADTLLYLDHADLCLLVLRSKQSKLGAFTSALNKINKTSSCPVGILLNYFDTQTASTYGFTHYYYGDDYYKGYSA